VSWRELPCSHTIFVSPTRCFLMRNCECQLPTSFPIISLMVLVYGKNLMTMNVTSSYLSGEEYLLTWPLMYSNPNNCGWSRYRIIENICWEKVFQVVNFENRFFVQQRKIKQMLHKMIFSDNSHRNRLLNQSHLVQLHLYCESSLKIISCNISLRPVFHVTTPMVLDLQN
jgi:hypothetical protein